MSSTESKSACISINPLLHDKELTRRFRDAYKTRLPVEVKGSYANESYFIFFLRKIDICQVKG